MSPPSPLPDGSPQTAQPEAAGPTGDSAGGEAEPAPGASLKTDEAPSDTSSAPAPGQRAFEGTAGLTKQVRQLAGIADLVAVRAGRHEGFDRVVFEFGGELPGYEVEYIDKPVRACGSGDVVPLAGDGWLEVRFTPARAHTDEGKPTVPDRRQRPSLPIVLELASTCDFEGHVNWVLGVSSPNRYRVLELKSPNRLVVDVLHRVR